jgi:hypothetical protein
MTFLFFDKPSRSIRPDSLPLKTKLGFLTLSSSPKKINPKMRASVSSRLRKELADRGTRVSDAWSNEEMTRALTLALVRTSRKLEEKARARENARARCARKIT